MDWYSSICGSELPLLNSLVWPTHTAGTGISTDEAFRTAALLGDGVHTVSDMASSGFWVHMPISGGIFRCRGSYIQGWHTSIHSIPRPFYPSELTRMLPGWDASEHILSAACIHASEQLRRMLYLQRQGGIQVGIVGSGSYEQSWRAIPTQRPGPRDHLPATPASTGHS